MADNKKKTASVASSLYPRKTAKKSIPDKKENIAPPPLSSVQEVAVKKKKRFTLWIDTDVHKAFKVHVATKEFSASKYLEDLIRADLKL